MDVLHLKIVITGLLLSIVIYAIPWSDLLLGAVPRDDYVDLTSNEASKQDVHFVILGATGDLALRYLFPALFSIRSNSTPAGIRVTIYATSRQAPDVIRNSVELSIDAVVGCTEVVQRGFLSFIKYHQLRASEDFERLCTSIPSKDKVVFYLSIPPSAYANTVKNFGLFCKNGRREADIRLVLEKPFGADYSSANALFEELKQWFPFERYYLVDHYKAKEATIAIPKFFAKNPDIAADFISSSSSTIELVLNETLGVTDRISFYDETGVVRDVVQNHLMEILIDIVSAISKKVNGDLERSSLITNVSIDTVNFGQYESYNQELAKSAVREGPSNTPTFVHAEASLKSTLLKDVKVSFTAGKKLSRKVSQARLTFGDGEVDKEVVFHIGGQGLNFPAVLFRGFTRVSAWNDVSECVRSCNRGYSPLGESVQYGGWIYPQIVDLMGSVDKKLGTGRPAVIVATNGFTLRIDPFLLNPRPGLEIERTKLDYTQYAFNRYQRQKRPKLHTSRKTRGCHVKTPLDKPAKCNDMISSFFD